MRQVGISTSTQRFICWRRSRRPRRAGGSKGRPNHEPRRTAMIPRKKLSTAYALIATSFCIVATERFAAAQPPPIPPAPVPTPDGVTSPPGPSLPPEITNALKPIPLAEPAAGDDELAKLRKERYQVARSELSTRLEAFLPGTTGTTIDILFDCMNKRLLPAELALSDRPADKLAAYKRSLAVRKWVEWVNDLRYQAGRISIQDLQHSRFERLNVEIKLLEGKPASDKAELQKRRVERMEAAH